MRTGLQGRSAGGKRNRGDTTVTGCIRKGVNVWQMIEVILHELTESSGVRKTDHVTGFAMLVP